MQALLVDDEKISLNALRRRVDWSKYGVDNVFTALSMQEAQEILCHEEIDFMLSDIEMPNGNGLELFEWVKIYYPAVECIYVTCHPEYEYMRHALKLGSADYLLKPINYADLDEILTALVERLQRTDQVAEIPHSILHKISTRELPAGQSEVVRQAGQFILEHIQETIYVKEIARTVHLNEQYLMRVFKKETGLTILEYITNERISMAEELLKETDFPITKVADSVGYGNYSYFTRIFKRYTGGSPKNYRSRYRAAESR